MTWPDFAVSTAALFCCDDASIFYVETSKVVSSSTCGRLFIFFPMKVESINHRTLKDFSQILFSSVDGVGKHCRWWHIEIALLTEVLLFITNQPLPALCAHNFHISFSSFHRPQPPIAGVCWRSANNGKIKCSSCSFSDVCGENSSETLQRFTSI